MKSIETENIEAGKKVLINTNTFFCKCIENTQYKYFLKVLKIQIVLNTKGLIKNIKLQFHMEETFMQKPHQNGFSSKRIHFCSKYMT